MKLWHEPDPDRWPQLGEQCINAGAGIDVSQWGLIDSRGQSRLPSANNCAGANIVTFSE